MNKPFRNNLEIKALEQTLIMDSTVEQMSWGEGAITAQVVSEEDREVIIESFAKSLVTVEESLLDKSGCTDGRVREGMLDGSEAPILEKNVGCDIIEMYFAAEILGEEFYGVTDSGDFDSRIKYLFYFMSENGLTPTTHEGCGAREGFTAVVANLEKYLTDRDTAEKIKSRIGAFSAYTLDDAAYKDFSDRLSKRDFSDYDPETLRQKVIDYSGEKAVKVLLDDGRGVHGHTEGLIVHIQKEAVAHSTRKMRSELKEANIADDNKFIEVFTVNDLRNDRLVGMMSKGDERLAKLAAIAIHGFGDAGHATLSSGLTTLILK